MRLKISAHIDGKRTDELGVIFKPLENKTNDEESQQWD